MNTFGVCMLLVFVFGIVATIFTYRIYSNGKKQFKKYDKANSALHFNSVTELASKLSAYPDIAILRNDPKSNMLQFAIGKNDGMINIENGIAFVEYEKLDDLETLKSKDKVKKILPFVSTVKKAANINSVLDRISNFEDSLKSSEYRAFKTNSKIILISVVSMILSCIIAIVSLIGGAKQKAVDIVKETEFFGGITYEDIIDGYLVDPKWEAFDSDANATVVEVNGRSVENELICIQFKGDAGMSLGNIDHQSFYPYYFEVDGTQVDPTVGMDIMYEYLVY